MKPIRSEDDILKSFEGLDRAPGSKQKRREVTPLAEARQAKANGETNGWDSNPVIKSLKGVETEFFTIGALAQALEKSLVTIRLWEKKGYIPSAPFRLRSKELNGKKVLGNRVYTRELIQIAIEEFTARGLLGSARGEWNQYDELTDVLKHRWEQIVPNRES
jgi:hypothetical protein